MMKRSLSLQLVALACLIVSVSALAAEQVTIVHMTHQGTAISWHRYVKEVAAISREYRTSKSRSPSAPATVHRQVPCDDRRRHAARHYGLPRVSATWRWKGCSDLAPYLAREEAYIREGFRRTPELYSDDMLGMPNSLFMVVSGITKIC